jgi:diguanylate cyclase (GGDEF)-like protein/PAS domain S-box-containing protein
MTSKEIGRERGAGSWLPLLAFGAYAAGFVTWSALHPAPSFDTVRDLLATPQWALVVAFCLGAASDPDLDAGTRRAWRRLAAARVLYLAGDVLWAYDSATGTGHPVLSLASLCYLASNPLFLWGLLSFPRIAQTRGQRVQFWLDALTVFVGGTMLFYFAVGPLTEEAFRPGRAALATGYLLGDLLLVFGLAVTLLRQSDRWTRPAFVALGLGVFFELGGDLLQGFFARTGRFDQAGPESLTVLSSALGGLAAYLHRRGARRSRAEPASETAASLSLLPYASLALGFAILVAATFDDRASLLRGLVLGAVALTAVVAARQIVTARDNMRLLAEQATRRSEARFAALVKNSSDVVTLVDAAGIVRYQTPSVERVLGYEPDELLGAPLETLVFEADLPAFQELLLLATQRSGVTGPFEVRLLRKLQGYLFVEMSAANLLDNPDLAGVVVTIRDTNERKLLEDRLAHLAFHDPLTGLANRALLTDRLAHALAGVRRGGEPLALLLLDLDNFKNANDSLGHPAGDQILVEVARRIGACVRETDTAARLGGDEFAVLLEDMETEERATDIAARLSLLLREPFAVSGKELYLGASIGIAVGGRSGDSVGDLFRNADVAMYAAKQRGKDRFVAFEAHMRAEALDRVELEADLHHALERDELKVHFQPVVRLQNGFITGAEALVRWRHPRRGLLAPGAFLALAEDTDLIVAMGAWVLEEACRQAQKWPERRSDGRAFRVSVNLSGRQLQRPSLVEDTREALRRTGLPPERLVLEITENMPLLETPSMAARLRDLKALGVSLAIDDFGTGYSSLSYLQLLPMDILKIDRSFVLAMGNGSRASPLLRGIVDLGRAMQLQTTAEGVETPIQAAALRDFGCEDAQGFLYSRALEPEAFVGLLRTRDRLPAAVGA